MTLAYSCIIFSSNVPPIAAGLLIASAVMLAYIFVVYLLRLMPVWRRRRQCDSTLQESGNAGGAIGASVVVYSRDEAENLAELLPAILSQNYSGPMEVIVVNEGESLDVRDLVARLCTEHSNIYLTFTPDGARSLSRKKLALTLGVKAARYPVAVMTVASARITSDLWLESIMRHFADDSTEVVLGVAVPEHRYGALRTYDMGADAARWLAEALAGHAYRGDEYNLAYRRDTFFRNKGFSRSLNLHNGDDDIFISEICNSENTAVELSEASIVRIGEVFSRKQFRQRTMRRMFTESRISHRPGKLLGLTGLFQSLVVLCAAGAVVADPCNWLTIIAASLLFVLLFVMDIVMWGKLLQSLMLHTTGLATPLLAMTRPFRRFLASRAARMGHFKKYTWN